MSRDDPANASTPSAFIARPEDACALAAGEVPPDAVNTDKTPREVAIVLYGGDEVAENWYSDGGLRAKTRRRIAKARKLMKGGYRKLTARLQRQ